jgi:hypothetical protein
MKILVWIESHDKTFDEAMEDIKRDLSSRYTVMRSLKIDADVKIKVEIN